MEYLRVNNDINGNPRYVFHFLSFLTDSEQESIRSKARPFRVISDMYDVAIDKARAIGGKKYRGKDFGGGIVFQSYNIEFTIKQIQGLTN